MLSTQRSSRGKLLASREKSVVGDVRKRFAVSHDLLALMLKRQCDACPPCSLQDMAAWSEANAKRESTDVRVQMSTE
jgi:hypothetical protein